MNKAIFVIGILLLVVVGTSVYIVLQLRPATPINNQNGNAQTSTSPQYTNPVLDDILTLQKPPEQQTPSSSPVEAIETPKLPDFLEWNVTASSAIPRALTYDNFEFEANPGKQFQKTISLSGSQAIGIASSSCSEDPYELIEKVDAYYAQEFTKKKGWTPDAVSIPSQGTISQRSIESLGDNVLMYLSFDGAHLRVVVLSFVLKPLTSCPKTTTFTVFMSDPISLRDL